MSIPMSSLFLQPTLNLTVLLRERHEPKNQP
jgi:hypothetical protein